MNVKQTYEAELAARGYTADPAQLRAVVALERCAHEADRRKDALRTGHVSPVSTSRRSSDRYS